MNNTLIKYLKMKLAIYDAEFEDCHRRLMDALEVDDWDSARYWDKKANVALGEGDEIYEFLCDLKGVDELEYLGD